MDSKHTQPDKPDPNQASAAKNTAPAKQVTRCPQCGTSFRVSAAQLQSARGAVRCGSCLQVFKARDHLIGVTAEPETSSMAKTPASEGLSFDQSRIDAELQDDDDDFLISDDMDREETAEEADPFGVGESLQTHTTRSLFERAPREAEDEEAHRRHEAADESWAMSLLEEEEANALDEHRDEPPDEPLVEERETHTAMPFQLAGGEPEAAAPPPPENDGAEIPLLAHFDPGPVEMQGRRKPQRKRRWLWPTLVAVALILTTVHIAWLQFDRLSRQTPYRSVYAAVCPVLGCTVPDLIDPARIRAYNLVVRDHPQHQGALIVDAILLNTAPFSQPFPDLVLEFTALEGSTVAVRQFEPSEYLSGELSGRRIMPANQPVHLTLELVDPGPDAINYRAYIPDT